MPKVFISYRRSDTQMVAGRLRDALAQRLGAHAIFRDKDSIEGGQDWTRAIEEGLKGDVIVLALIGQTWATAKDESGTRRLDNPDDWNRVELEQALKRARTVVPLLVDGATMPAEAELPESLHQLRRLHALKLRDDDWDADLDRIVRVIGGASRRAAWWRTAAAIAALVVIAAGSAYWWRSRTEEAVQPPARNEPALASSFREDVHKRLYDDLESAFRLLLSENRAERAKAIGVVDGNLARMNAALESFPDDPYIHALAGYAAKNVFESARDNGLLTPEQRKKYLSQARSHFEAALKIQPNDPSALNGMGNVSFYEGKFDAAIRYHEAAIKAAHGAYPNAKHDLDLVKRVKRGEIEFRP